MLKTVCSSQVIKQTELVYKLYLGKTMYLNFMIKSSFVNEIN